MILRSPRSPRSPDAVEFESPMPATKLANSRPIRPTLFTLSCLAVISVICFGCLSPDEYKAQADEEAYAIVAKARKVAGQADDSRFTIEPDGERLHHRIVLAPLDDRRPLPKERLATEGKAVDISLADALAIASRNSREFQDEKERLYLVALSLTGQWNNFESQYFGMVGADARSSGDNGSDSTLSLAEDSSFGFTRLFERGGQMSLAIGQDLTRFFSNPADTIADAFVNLTISLPLLRGAGRDIAYENVIQSERDVVYGVRAFERFKRTFGVAVSSDYLRLLQSLQTIQNEEANLDRRRQTATENRFLGEAGRIARTDVERANQAVLSAENRLIVVRQNYEGALDGFKQTLGLPTDATANIDAADLDRLTRPEENEATLAGEEALVVALGSRLDLATAYNRVNDAVRGANVAADALRAGLDFTGSVNLNTSDFANRSFKLDLVGDGDYTFGLDLDLPFERTAERNAYRQSLIGLEVAKRDAEAFEDSVKFQVRNAQRNLQEARDTFRIQEESLRVAETNVEAASLLKEAGQGTTLDLLDAQNDLIAAQNAVTRALIDYTIARLELYRDMGILVVAPDGIDDEATQKLLEASRADD